MKANKRYLITGASGQLGYDIVKELNRRGITDVLAPSSKDLDITDEIVVNNFMEKYHPDYVIHCAAYTQVDKAEDDIEMCYKVNGEGTRNIVEACRRIGATVTYISTDYVFDGTKDGVYEVTDEVNPINIYGKTKYLGEEYTRRYDKHFIVRISWVFGINGKNFVKTMLNLAQTRDEVSVVSDQFGSPTYTVDVAKKIVDMQATKKYGTYHATNDGYCNWAEFANYIFESNDLYTKVNPILTKDYPTKATRPMNSKLSKRSLVENGFGELIHWKDSVDNYNIELIQQKVKCKK